MNTLSLCKTLIRPKTLIASISPVLLTSAWALKDNTFSFGLFSLLLATALMLQILSNVANDYFDGLKGTDNSQRVGPERFSAQNPEKAHKVRLVLLATFLLTLTLGIILSVKGGALVAFTFCVAMICSILYTAGPYALSYRGLAEPFAFAFFGPIPAVFASYLYSGSFSLSTFLLGCLSGFYSLILITINNLRDYESDKASHKKTLIVKKGKVFGKRLIYFAFIAMAVVTVIIGLYVPKFILSFVLIPEVYTFVKDLNRSYEPYDFLPLLKSCAKLYLLSSVLWTSFIML